MENAQYFSITYRFSLTPLVYPISETLACTSYHIDVLILIELALPEKYHFVSTTLTEKVSPHSICRRIDDAVEASVEFIEPLRAVKIHLEDTILRAVAKIFKDFSQLCPTPIITDIVSYHVEHIHTS